MLSIHDQINLIYADLKTELTTDQIHKIYDLVDLEIEAERLSNL